MTHSIDCSFRLRRTIETPGRAVRRHATLCLGLILFLSWNLIDAVASRAETDRHSGPASVAESGPGPGPTSEPPDRLWGPAVPVALPPLIGPEQELRDRHAEHDLRDRHAEQELRDRHAEQELRDRHAEQELRDRHAEHDLRMRATDVGHAPHDESPSIDVRRMPGEFERQQTLLVGGSSLVYAAPNVFADIARGVRGRLTLVALVNDDFDRHICAEALAKREVARDAARFVRLRHDSMWVRDFGPISVLDTQGRSWLVDSLYNELGRTHDEVVPNVLAQMAVAPMFRSNLNVDGGNVLSNGAGILLTTNAIVEDNPGHTQQSLGKLLGKYFGGRYVVFLEPLANESTGHVDMFATFTSPDTVVVGSYDPKYDPVNAAILDRNAAILASLQTSNGPMQVVRIPMPAHDEEIWRTYTNVVYANGILMIPAYANSPAPLEDQVIGSYQSLLPHWHILTINVDNVIRSGGALHCLTMNMGALRSSELDEAHTLPPPLLEEFPSDDLSAQARVAQ